MGRAVRSLPIVARGRGSEVCIPKVKERNSLGMAELQRRGLGRIEMWPRALALGCAYFGASHHTDREAIDGVRRAVELGIDFVDTSPH